MGAVFVGSLHGMRTWLEADPESSRSWIATHMEKYKEHRLRWGAAGAPETAKESPWWASLTDREKDVVGFMTHVYPEATVIHVDQSIGRVPMDSVLEHELEGGVKVRVAPTQLPKEKAWLVQRNRLLLGMEGMVLQGFPVTAGKLYDIACAFPDPLLQDLAGNSFGSLLILSMISATLCALPWAEETKLDDPAARDETTASADSNVALARDALQSLGICLDDM